MSSHSVLTLMGEQISPNELRRRYLDGDVAIDLLIYQQLLADATSDASHSEGLLAISVLWERPVCRRIISRYIADEEGQEEAWKEALYLIYSRVAGFDPTRSRFGTWVFNQGKYAALNEKRRRARDRRRDRAASEYIENEIIEFDISDWSDRERKAAFRAMKRLTENERIMIEQRVLLDASYEEIFEELGGSVKRDHIRIYVGRAIERLKKFCAEELEGR